MAACITILIGGRANEKWRREYNEMESNPAIILVTIILAGYFLLSAILSGGAAAFFK
jgi:hypothetical protein